jgi:hypothetical protein
MTSDPPAYYSLASLREACGGISQATLKRHVKLNTEGIGKAKKTIPNIGVRFPNNAVVRNFIALMSARKKP